LPWFSYLCMQHPASEQMMQGSPTNIAHVSKRLQPSDIKDGSKQTSNAENSIAKLA
jgi:hypothetical protein